MSSYKNPKQVNALLLTQNDHFKSSQSNSIYFHRKLLITFQIFHWFCAASEMHLPMCKAWQNFHKCSWTQTMLLSNQLPQIWWKRSCSSSNRVCLEQKLSKQIQCRQPSVWWMSVHGLNTCKATSINGLFSLSAPFLTRKSSDCLDEVKRIETILKSCEYEAFIWIFMPFTAWLQCISFGSIDTNEIFTG